MPNSARIKDEYRKVFYPGGVIFREGEPAEDAYIIESGRVVISSLVNGRKTLLATLGAGELFGEMALVDAGVRTATATALDKVELVVVSKAYVKSKLSQADPLISLFLQVIMKRLRGWRERLSYTSPVVRTDEEDEGDYEEQLSIVQEVARLNRDLHLALDERQFDIFYQPITALDEKRVCGFEALVRWQHPSRGLVPPNDFIGLAEETGLIIPLGGQVLHEACRGFQRILKYGHKLGMDTAGWFISINVSPRQVADEGFITSLADSLEGTGLKAEQIKLEITEGLLMRDPDEAEKILLAVKALGFSLAIDDFGTGYSSLSYLHRFPIDTLKIDRSFVRSEDKKNRTIVEAIVGLARSMKLHTVAEGIEEPRDHEYLRGIGVGMGQGYLISRPVAEKEIGVFLKQLATRQQKAGDTRRKKP